MLTTINNEQKKVAPIKSRHVSRFPLNRLDEKTQQCLRGVSAKIHVDGSSLRTSMAQCLHLFNAFLDISNVSFNVLTLNRPSLMARISQAFVGFLYSQTNLSLSGVHIAAIAFKQTMQRAAHDFGMDYRCEIHISNKRITEYAQQGIELIATMPFEAERQRFYAGWYGTSADGKDFFVDMVRFYKQYGEALTNEYFRVISNFLTRFPFISIESYRRQLNHILSTLCDAFPDANALACLQDSAEVNSFVEYMFNEHRLKASARQEDVATFYNCWKIRVYLLERIFIEGRLIAEPAYKLFCPEFRTRKAALPKRIKYDDDGNAFNNKLITRIPLSCSDDQAIVQLLSSIHEDIDYVSTLCTEMVDETMANMEKRRSAAKLGTPLYLTRNSSDPHGIDKYDFNNQCATWERYTYAPCEKTHRKTAMYGRNFSMLARRMGLLTNHSLIPFLYLLVEQHNEITPQWFINFELFDKHGQLSGITESGGLTLATSYKGRRGAQNAQQTVILNARSKALFEGIVAHTQQARDYLRENRDPQWRYLLLGAGNGFNRPVRITELKLSTRRPKGESMWDYAVSNENSKLPKSRIENIFENLSLSSMRASCGVRVYLKTLSVRAMSEALGHKKYEPNLLSHYLPDTIRRFFMNRWVRIFQNAIVFEAMQESSMLIDSMDVQSEVELQQFIKNHRLAPLPAHILEGNLDNLQPSQQGLGRRQFDEVYLAVSTQVFSLYLSLIHVVENRDRAMKLNETSWHWYEVAKFAVESVRNFGKTQGSAQISPEVLTAFSSASVCQMFNEKLKGAIYAA